MCNIFFNLSVFLCHGFKTKILRAKFGEDPIESMGLVCLPLCMVDFYDKFVGKYTTPMDPMGNTYEGHADSGCKIVEQIYSL